MNLLTFFLHTEHVWRRRVTLQTVAGDAREGAGSEAPWSGKDAEQIGELVRKGGEHFVMRFKWLRGSILV